MELILATTFGLEAVARREVEALGYKVVKTENGKVTFIGDVRAIARANLWIRTADSVQIKMAEFDALTFEDIFQMVKGIEWEEWIPLDGHFILNASSVKSKLSSVPAIQSVAEKAVVDRLSEVYGVKHFDKTGAIFDIKLTLLKDRVTVTLDTTGPSLHKRGYRKRSVTAPIKETIASALVLLSFWKEDRILVDPCCGSGTIPIEAAMIAENIAPGINRVFASSEWDAIPSKIWDEERERAKSEIKDIDLKIYASDIDASAIKVAKENAILAGVDKYIKFNVADIAKMRTSSEYGIWITNPPYGERIGDENVLKGIYSKFSEFFRENPTWSLFVISPDKNMEKKVMGRMADRRRKLYNGNIEVCYYQFHGKKK